MIGAVGLLGFVLSCATFFLVPTRRGEPSSTVFLGCLVLHLAATLLVWWLSRDAGYDARFYYDDTARWVNKPFGFGTVFVIKFVQFVRQTIGGTFLDHFLLFQAFGMTGIVLVLRTFDELAEALGVRVPPVAYALLFLPNLHFWTVGIGKDAPLMAASAITVWAALSIERRIAAFALGTFIMLLFRPHIAAIAFAAAVLALMLDARKPIVAKAVFAPPALAALIYVAATLETQVGVNPLNASSLSTFIEASQSTALNYGDAGVVTLPYPLKVLSLLFRPFFFDAGNVLGLLASLENVVLFVLVLFLAWNGRSVVKLAARSFFAGYCLAFAVGVVGLLSALNYNVGLGLRQKVMVYPQLLVLAVVLLMYAKRRVSARLSPATA